MTARGLLHQGSLIVFVFVLLLLPRFVHAQTSVTPGSSVTLSQADGSSTNCQIGSASANCAVFARFSGTAAGGKTVRAHYDQLLPAIGAPNYARAAVFADFAVPGSPNTLVAAQISTTFDFDSSMFGAGAYKTAATLSLRVTDLSVGSGVDIATQTLVEQERSGDQGVTDVNGGSETQSIPGASSGFQVVLRRGHTYRLTFEVEVLGEALVVGKVVSDAGATWTHSRISVDEDEVELLAAHDAAVRGELAAHDSGVRAAVASHDAAIKQLLAQIEAKLDQQAAELAAIEALLLMPQGQRPGFPSK